MALTREQYRDTRADIRRQCSIALDQLDTIYAALQRGHADLAHNAAQYLALVADDLTASLERIVREVTYVPAP